jgi:GNAT superfamily N-acetyltransferase
VTGLARTDGLGVRIATEEHAAEIATLRTRVGDDLAARYGLRPSCVTEKAVLRGIAASRTLVSSADGVIVATLRLATKKPWAIDTAYFTPVDRALYLHDMAVDPVQQNNGLGRALVEEAMTQARAWPAQAIRLDAYDAPHGAGGFYAKCGFCEVGRAAYRRTPLIYYELLL